VSALEIQSLGVSYAGSGGVVTALSDFSLNVPEGGLTVLLGESGCGKSTALNSVAGLTQPTVGRIRLNDQVLFDSSGRRPVNVPPNHRNIGMVFQSYALWPHLSVLANVMYPLLRRSTNKTEAERLANDALAMVRCNKLGHRIPAELSGGQQQRVALARALVSRPKLLLFDEPLSNLDASLRRNLREELAELHREIGFTGLYVTHDQAEALALGTEIAVMDSGRILQSGPPSQIYERPGTEFVARFFGANVVRGSANGTTITTPFGQFESNAHVASGAVAVAFMPDAVEIESGGDGRLLVKSVTYLGAYREIGLANDECEFIAIARTRKPVPEVNSRVTVRIRPSDLHAYTVADAKDLYLTKDDPPHGPAR
jgi:iron(III) transport system ATP-binding protein